MNTNYQLLTDSIISSLKDKPTLLLHSCCAPCSSYCLEYLTKYFKVTIFYYNPNIYPPEEYDKRIKEQQQFVKTAPFCKDVNVYDIGYHSEEFYEIAKGLENVKEGGERCFKCYELRLRKTAETALKLGSEYFTTTLSISPMKNSQIINKLGEKISQEYNIKYLFSDFKKRNGFKRSTELSNQYGIYRQNYCGCIYSFNERNSTI